MAVTMRRRELLSGAPILCIGNGWPLNQALARAASEPDGRRWASSSLVVGLTSSSQVLRSLSPAITPGFDFAPDRQAEIAAGDYALGDVDIRFRSDGMWQDISTAFRRIPVIPLPAEHGSIAAADLSPTLPAGLPFRIERRWLFDGDALVLRFTLRNLTTSPRRHRRCRLRHAFRQHIDRSNTRAGPRTCELCRPVCRAGRRPSPGNALERARSGIADHSRAGNAVRGLDADRRR